MFEHQLKVRLLPLFYKLQLVESTNSLVSLAPTRRKHQIPKYSSTNSYTENSVFSRAPPCHPVFIATTRWKIQLPIFKHQLEYQRTTVLLSATLPPYFLKLCLIATIQMFQYIPLLLCSAILLFFYLFMLGSTCCLFPFALSLFFSCF